MKDGVVIIDDAAAKFDAKKILEAIRLAKDEVIFRIFSEAFDDLDFYPQIYVEISELRSHLWKKHRINRKQFQEFLQRLYQVGSIYREQINLSGGPTHAYKKDNWVEVDGKHWLLIEIRTQKHEDYMVGHRS